MQLSDVDAEYPRGFKPSLPLRFPPPDWCDVCLAMISLAGSAIKEHGGYYSRCSCVQLSSSINPTGVTMKMDVLGKYGCVENISKRSQNQKLPENLSGSL